MSLTSAHPFDFEIIATLTEAGTILSPGKDVQLFFVGSLSELWVGKTHEETAQCPRVVAFKIFRNKAFKVPRGLSTFRMLMSGLAQSWESLSHPNIAPLYGVYVPDGAPVVVAPYFPNGNIVDYLKQNPGLPMEEIYRMVMETLHAITYLHGAGYTHGHLHAGNLLVTDEHHVVLSDVGLNATIRTIGDYHPVPDKCRSMPRELLFPPNDDTPQVTMASDVYSFACAVQEIYTLKPPFSKIKNDYMFIKQFAKGLLTDEARVAGVPDFLHASLLPCFADNAADRPTAQALLQQFEMIGSRLTNSS